MGKNIGVTPGKFSGNMYHPERMKTTARELHKRSKNFVDECPELYKIHHMKNDGANLLPKGKQSYMKEVSEDFMKFKAKKNSLFERITTLLENKYEFTEEEFLKKASKLIDEGKTTGKDPTATGKRVGKSVSKLMAAKRKARDEGENTDVKKGRGILSRAGRIGDRVGKRHDDDARSQFGYGVAAGIKEGKKLYLGFLIDEGRTTGGDPEATGERVGRAKNFTTKHDLKDARIAARLMKRGREKGKDPQETLFKFGKGSLKGQGR